jgi:hypothetical protein
MNPIDSHKGRIGTQPRSPQVTWVVDPECKETLTTWARREVYKKITDDLGGAA